ncbi:hypothetical protein TSUD_16280 [Trifolium subterraneum]|uniref:Uncharacterized protein n=1 Tax=Trifolium subterraneum TaxID=3900 RepID=A0A2Z6NCL6_TRISU|nr:hypothetical protein TSUD_16280 [Trifolium subterraneum]
MGGLMSKKTPGTTADMITELRSYEAACKLDSDLRSFDSNLQARTNQVINSLAVGVEVRSLSFDSLKQVTECLLEMNQEVVKVILDCKKDIWKSQELFELVEEYFDNSLKTLDFCNALEKCLKRARDSQLLIHVALQKFEDETESGDNRYARTLEELRNFKAAAIKDLDNIRILVNRLEVEIESLKMNVDFAIEEEEAVKVAIEEIKKKLGVFMKNVEDLGAQADTCSRDIIKARTVVLQRIVKLPHKKLFQDSRVLMFVSCDYVL